MFKLPNRKRPRPTEMDRRLSPFLDSPMLILPIGFLSYVLSFAGVDFSGIVGQAKGLLLFVPYWVVGVFGYRRLKSYYTARLQEEDRNTIPKHSTQAIAHRVNCCLWTVFLSATFLITHTVKNGKLPEKDPEAFLLLANVYPWIVTVIPLYVVSLYSYRRFRKPRTRAKAHELIELKERTLNKPPQI